MVELVKDEFETEFKDNKVLAKRVITELYSALEAENTMLRLRQKIEALEEEVKEQKRILSFFEKHEEAIKIARDGEVMFGKLEREEALMKEADKHFNSVVSKLESSPENMVKGDDA